MSKDIVVLTPNGRRMKVHCTPDTSILQVLEDVCQKQGINASDYNLKHHNHILDLTITLRFSNLPNKAFLELVEANQKRKETNVVIGLTLEDGERRTAEFPPYTSLYEIASLLALNELNSLRNPTISYMRQEIVGIAAMKDKTLRQLGLISGRAILRLLNKSEEQKQANVSAVYKPKPLPEFKNEEVQRPITEMEEKIRDPTTPTSSTLQEDTHTEEKRIKTDFDPISVIKNLKTEQNKPRNSNAITIKDSRESQPCHYANASNNQPKYSASEDHTQTPTTLSYNSLMLPENLERRLRIEEEVTFLGAQKAIAYMQPEQNEDVLEDLPNDFYELTVDEVRKLYHELQEERILLENTPLITSAKREELDKASSQLKLMTYKNVVVRIQFPDRIILQGVFAPSNTIQDVIDFIREHLRTPERPFLIFTTPLKESLDPTQTLLEAKFVPCVHMHFKWEHDNKTDGPYLKEDIYRRQTACDAASILASKYRAPTRRKAEESDRTQTSNAGSSTKKVPKWFKSK